MSQHAATHYVLDRIAEEEARYKAGEISRQEYEARRAAILGGSGEGADDGGESRDGRRISYGTTFGSLAPIVGANFVLNIVTLGLYRFWGITRVRRHLWSRIVFEGEEFEYTGRPTELLIGLVIALAFLIPLGAAYVFSLGAMAAQGASASAVLGAQVAYAAVLYLLVQVATYRARRYKLSRTLWRGIRAGQTGSSWRYGLTAIAAMCVTILTLGLANPWRRTLLYRFKYDNTWLGNQRFGFDGSAAHLFSKWLVCWLLYPFTLGLVYVWYLGHEYRYFASQTRYGGLTFRSSLSGAELFVVFLVYGIVLGAFYGLVEGFASAMIGVGPADLRGLEGGLGDGASLVGVFVFSILVLAGFGAIYQLFYLHPLANKIIGNLSVLGEEDFDAIRQAARSDAKYGEGLAEALDVGGL